MVDVNEKGELEDIECEDDEDYENRKYGGYNN